MSASRWTETWFPLEQTGGLTDASRDGAMHVSLEDDRLAIGVNAFRDVADTLKVWSGDRFSWALRRTASLYGLRTRPLGIRLSVRS